MHFLFTFNRFFFFSFQEGDVTKTSSLTKSDGLFYMVTEISVVFVDFTKCQNVCNFLVEKLDDSVHISQPHFFHGIQSLDAVRLVYAVNIIAITVLL